VLRHLTVLRKKADITPSSMMKTVEREDARKAQQAEFHGNNNDRNNSDRNNDRNN